MENVIHQSSNSILTVLTAFFLVLQLVLVQLYSFSESHRQSAPTTTAIRVRFKHAQPRAEAPHQLRKQSVAKQKKLQLPRTAPESQSQTANPAATSQPAVLASIRTKSAMNRAAPLTDKEATDHEPLKSKASHAITEEKQTDVNRNKESVRSPRTNEPAETASPSRNREIDAQAVHQLDETPRVFGLTAKQEPNQAITPSDTIHYSDVSLLGDLVREFITGINHLTYYPNSAIRRKMTGTVFVSLDFNKQAGINLVRIKESSGYGILDRSACKMIEEHQKQLERYLDQHRLQFATPVSIDLPVRFVLK